MFPISHKTILVIDNSLSFINKSSSQPIEYDVCLKIRGSTPPGIIPLAPISKSFWTCCVESIQEYVRIVFDIYPQYDKLISLITSNEKTAKVLSEWDNEHQSLNFINTCFAKSRLNVFHQSCDDPSFSSCILGSENITLMNGIRAAIEILGKPSPIQTHLKKKNKPITNRGRIILFSSFKDNHQIKTMADFIFECLSKYNSSIRENMNDTEKLMINECHFVMINTFSSNDTTVLEDVSHQIISPLLSFEVHSAKVGTNLASKLISLVLSHYNLASTTVTGIPMKEEQNASSSANYDVEIVHPIEAHLDLFKSAIGSGENIRSLKEGFSYEKISLKWCTPRTNSVELHHCTTAHRISPVDVNSRPSSCLTNFLLSGRTVMLEMTKLKGSKVMSHMLSSHNDELYIHSLSTGRSILEDPPSICEGSGGRVTDYRINDFGDFMKKNKLIRCKNLVGPGRETIAPIEKAIFSLKRQTLYWPMVIGHTIIFNIQVHIQSLLNLIPKESLTIEDVNECKNAIYQIVSMESKGTSLVLLSISSRGKGPKKEELYKLLWKELEYFIEIHATTPEHKAVLNCLRELHSKNENGLKVKSEAISSSSSTTETNVLSKKLTAKEDAELAWKELDCYNNLTEREKSDLNKSVKKPRIFESKPLNNFSSNMVQQNGNSNNERQSLLSLWMKKFEDINSRQKNEFEGRSMTIAPLYVHLNESTDQSFNNN